MRRSKRMGGFEAVTATYHHDADSQDTEALLEQVANGDGEALGRILERERAYLRRLLDFRMGPDLRSRVDPSDVIQETQLAVNLRIEEFLSQRPTSFRLWLRNKALEQLSNLRRKHVGALKRSVRREIKRPDASSVALAAAIITDHPSSIARRRELSQQTEEAMAQLPDKDREVLLLRHVEALSNAEVAELLGISGDAASKRYGRAILRLRNKLIRAGALSNT